MRKLSQGVLFFAGLLSPASTPLIHYAVPRFPPPPPDSRVERLRDFLDGTPTADHAEDFVLAADRHGLDWRLLPSISMIESGAGRECKNNNIFGWDCGRAQFSTLRSAIDHVADRLANSKLYKDKDLDSLLWTYNPRQDYPFRVKRLMRTLAAPAPNPGLSPD